MSTLPKTSFISSFGQKEKKKSALLTTQLNNAHSSFTRFRAKCVQMAETSAESCTALNKTDVDETDISSRVESTVSPEVGKNTRTLYLRERRDTFSNKFLFHLS